MEEQSELTKHDPVFGGLLPGANGHSRQHSANDADASLPATSGFSVATSTTIDDGERVRHCVSHVINVLHRRDLLHEVTPAGVDFIAALPKDWVIYEADLSSALSGVVSSGSKTQHDLLEKFRCLDGLLDTFDPEDARVIRMKDALLQECRAWLSARCDVAEGAGNCPVAPKLPVSNLRTGTTLNGMRRSQA